MIEYFTINLSTWQTSTKGKWVSVADWQYQTHWKIIAILHVCSYDFS